MNVRTFLTFIAFAGFVTLTYGGWQYLFFIKKVEQARLSARPANDLPTRTGISWMIANPGVVPDGDDHRTKAIAAFGAFLAIWLVGIIAAICGR